MRKIKRGPATLLYMNSALETLRSREPEFFNQKLVVYQNWFWYVWCSFGMVWWTLVYYTKVWFWYGFDMCWCTYQTSTKTYVILSSIHINHSEATNIKIIPKLPKTFGIVFDVTYQNSTLL